MSRFKGGALKTTRFHPAVKGGCHDGFVGHSRVREATLTTLPAFKAPKRIVLSDALPKTERGKLDRKALTERWNRERAG